MVVSFVILAFFLVGLVFKPYYTMMIMAITYPTLSMFSINKIPIVLILLFLALISVFIKYQGKKQVIRSFPFYLSFFICVFSYIISYYLAQTRGHINGIIAPLTQYALILVVWYYWPKDSGKYKRFFYKASFIYLLIISVYGIYQALTGENAFINYMYKTGQVELDVGEGMRYGVYRAQSLTLWFETYAATCGMGLVFFVISMVNKVIKTNVYYFALCLLLSISVLTAGSRSMLIMTAFMLLSVLPKMFSNLKVIFGILIAFIAIYYFQEDLIDQIIDSIVHQDKFNGSSSDMRLYQMYSTLAFLSQSPVFGNGPGYISFATSMSQDLQGGESIIFSTLIDRGILGMITIVLIYMQMIVFFYKKHRIDIVIMIVGFLIGKILTMLPGMGDIYILMYAIPLYKFAVTTRTKLEAK